MMLKRAMGRLRSGFRTSAAIPASASIGTENETARERWLAATLSALPAGWRILDAGAGECQYRQFCQHLDYVSQDFAEYRAGEGAGLHPARWDTSSIDIVSDITSIPAPSSSFDAVMCVEVLEHLPDPVSALRELERLLKPAGKLIVTAPFCSLTHFAPFHFSTGFSRFWFEHWLSGLGLEIEVLELSGDYFSYLGQELRRLHDIANRYAPTAPFTRQTRQAVSTVLGALQALHDADSGSKELLCYGIHVIARKRAAS
jgi:ubiquinone/menaquinone biosynthesis C-methylase UbiE